MLDNVPASMKMQYETAEPSFDAHYYYQILKKRIFYILVPFVIIFAAGFGGAMLWPPTFLSEGKILVESQQIPPDLVPPTVTATPKQRAQVLEQRVMTRGNLLAVADKDERVADQRDQWSRTELLDLMREDTQIKPLELDPQGRRNEKVTIAITVGFTHRRPEIAMKVANELLT